VGQEQKKKKKKKKGKKGKNKTPLTHLQLRPGDFRCALVKLAAVLHATNAFKFSRQ
jgi:hypothetical protein